MCHPAGSGPVDLVSRNEDELHQLATAPHAVGTNWTRTLTLGHLVLVNKCAPGTNDKGRTVVVAESSIDEVLFPADWAIRHMLRAHLS